MSERVIKLAIFALAGALALQPATAFANCDSLLATLAAGNCPAAGGSGSAPTFAGADGSTSGGNDCNMTDSFTAGQTIVVAGVSTTGGVSFSISGGGLTYTPLFASPFADSNGNTVNQVWTARAASTGSITIDVHVSSSANWLACVDLWATGANASPVDQAPTPASNVATTSYVTPTTGTTSQANELAVCIYSAGGTAPATTFNTVCTSNDKEVNSGGSPTAHVAIGHGTLSATGAYHGTATMSTGATGAGIIATLTGP